MEKEITMVSRSWIEQTKALLWKSNLSDQEKEDVASYHAIQYWGRQDLFVSATHHPPGTSVVHRSGYIVPGQSNEETWLVIGNDSSTPSLEAWVVRHTDGSWDIWPDPIPKT